MKFVLASSFVPFIDGGARFIVDWLAIKLREHGHAVDRFYFPFVDEPDTLLDQMSSYRLMKLADRCDRLVTFRPPAHIIRHPYKIVWFIHHIRVFYDLWDTHYCPVPHDLRNAALRTTLHDIDSRALQEAQHVFTNSNVVRDRVARFNGVSATTLYPPLLNPERFFSSGFGAEIFAVCRIEPHKRPLLLIDAMKYVRTDVRLRICGVSANPVYGKQIQQAVRRHPRREQISFENRWISEEEKISFLSQALAAAYLPEDEDSYGYPSLEAAYASKPVLTTSDSGGVLELIEHRHNGLVVPSTAQALAEAMDELYTNRPFAAHLGRNNRQRLNELQINWDHVVAAVTR